MEAFTFLIMLRAACRTLCQVRYPKCSSLLFVGSLQQAGLVAPVRAVAFSPGGKLLAAAGDSKVIALYETSSGEQVANLTGHSAWVMSLDWSDSGEYLLSGCENCLVHSQVPVLTPIVGLSMVKSRCGQSTERSVLPPIRSRRRLFGA